MFFDCAGASGSRVGSRKRKKKCGGPVYGDVGFDIILNIIRDVILELKMHPKSHCNLLWVPWLGGQLGLLLGSLQKYLKTTAARSSGEFRKWDPVGP